MVLPKFNPACAIAVEPIFDDFRVAIVDNALLNGEELVEFAARTIDTFRVNMANNYPGPELVLPPAVADAARKFFVERIQPLFGLADTAPQGHARLSIATQPPETLYPHQRLCHTDDKTCPPGMRAMAGVLYLFHNPELGGTAFYRHRPGTDYAATAMEYSRADADRKRELAASYPFLAAPPRYLTGSNEFVELQRVIPAAWNRMIFYRGDVPHTPHLTRPDLLLRNPRRGRLSMNLFLRCAIS